MRYLFSTESQPRLGQLAAERTLCAFDFDGTLAPVAPRPELAGMRDRTRELLTRVASLYPCVVLTGRDRRDVVKKLHGVPVERVIGNHGAAAAVEAAQTVSEWKRVLDEGLAGQAEIWVEDKGLSLAVHYRQARLKSKARRTIAGLTAQLRGARVSGAGDAVHIAAAEIPPKGPALAAERARLGCDRVLFVGDDPMDGAVFEAAEQSMPVRVGENGRSRARYYLKDQTEVDRLLERLAVLRERVG